MAQRRTPPNHNDPPPKLRVSRAQAREKIAERLRRGEEIGERPITGSEELERARQQYYTWSEVNQTLLDSLFDSRSVAQKYRGFLFGSIGPVDFDTDRKSFLEDVAGSVRRLTSIVESLDYYEEVPGVASPGSLPRVADRACDVFVVHGHDEATRETVARFLERLNLPVRILQEAASAGMTLIEKLEHYGKQAAFAVVLLTPDDVGADKDHPAELRPRARQNVVLELGYFLGKIGRARVCALYGEGVELPSDYSGVLYVRLDADGAWKLPLAREIKQAGIDVDLNQAL